jgi:hypothetical protein
MPARDDREDRVRLHQQLAAYDQHQSTHDMVAYAAHAADGGPPETVLIRRDLAVAMGEPLHVTFTVQPGDHVGDHLT